VAIDRHPALVALPVGAGDMQAAVKFAASNDLRRSVRSGGRGVSGAAVAEDGLAIDLSRMMGTPVDPRRRVVRVETGLTWVEVNPRLVEIPKRYGPTNLFRMNQNIAPGQARFSAYPPLRPI
jgi:FAD/FMN-containing dehydrogenase